MFNLFSDTKVRPALLFLIHSCLVVCDDELNIEDEDWVFPVGEAVLCRLLAPPAKGRRMACGVICAHCRAHELFGCCFRSPARPLTRSRTSPCCGTSLEPTLLTSARALAQPATLSALVSLDPFCSSDVNAHEGAKCEVGSLIPGSNYSAQDDHAGVEVPGL
eukprot:1866038-Rhodomonas_salina.2